MRTDALITEILPPDMKVLMNHIYEYKKGVRQNGALHFQQEIRELCHGAP